MKALSLALLSIVLALPACRGDEVRSLRWDIAFADDALRARAAVVEGRILDGGCTSSAVRYAAEASPGTTPPMPPRLPPGRYGLEGRARDRECVVFASACVDVDVPQADGTTIVVTLAAVPEAAACPRARCAEGSCREAELDAGPPDAARDASVPEDAPPPECTTDAECGTCESCSAAGACEPAADGASCTDGACRAGACCTGCWDGAACVAGDTVAACGTGGAICAACAGATPFCTGACAGPRPVRALGTTGQSACAIATDGSLWCWGANTFGQLGIGTAGMGAEVLSPTRVGTASDWGDIVRGGDEHACATRGAGAELHCWGANGDGQLGTGDRTARTSPMRVSISAEWIHVASTVPGDHTCAIERSGGLYCWGQNDYGHLALGDFLATHTAPSRVGASSWRVVEAGHHFTCAIRSDGTLWCAGEDTYGTLADGTAGTMMSVSSLQQVGTATDWVSLGHGEQHACAVRTGGTLWCWGLDADGQLGRSGGGMAATPIQVGTATGWTQATGGLGHTCAIRAGELWCWGRNDFGQLGLGTSGSDVRSPARVGADADWAEVRAGESFTCARHEGGAIACWGACSLGQLGQGDRVTRTAPAQVLIPP